MNWKGNRAVSYTVSLNENISTSNSPSLVGAPADIYIGVNHSLVAAEARTIRAIPDSTFRQMQGRVAGEFLREIANGTDGGGNAFHLVSDRSLVYRPQVKSLFKYTQKYIINQLIPGIFNETKAMMFTGTEAEAKTQANATGKPVYLSLVSPDDEDHFAVINMKDMQYFLYTDKSAAEQGMNYRIILPDGYADDITEEDDEVRERYMMMMGWINMIAQNESDKLAANDLLQNFAIDGGSKFSYAEDFTSQYSNTNSFHWPAGNDSYFDVGGADLGLVAAHYGTMIIWSILSKVFPMVKGGAHFGTNTEIRGTQGTDDELTEIKLRFKGTKFSFKFAPVMSFDSNNDYTTTEGYSRSESFNISIPNGTHLDFDVYRVKNTQPSEAITPQDVFTSSDFYVNESVVRSFIDRHLDADDLMHSRGFVYRTRGGATAAPWEDRRATIFYAPGTTLDERTRRIQNGKLRLDKASISGVPYGEPARFKLYMTNESEVPEAAGGGMSFYRLYVDDSSNPHGARIMIDGLPLSGNPRTFTLLPGQMTEKTLEVYAGEDFDYEGLVIRLISSNDYDARINVEPSEAVFDVHYLHQAGAIDIASPGDKWIMNTDAQYNKERGWFIPVTISGFDHHQPNFDHIEFQYKETARGDDYWTNLCSFYADSLLLAQASGTKAIIPANDNITVEFYGEGTVMEKAYDLRAMLYRRDATGFVTSSSRVLSGIKDTRRPQLFGEPEPQDGILDAGESIIFNFSEDIEHQYLSAITHFEVVGETNNDNVTTDVSLRFSGEGSSLETEATRNFNGKDVTIEMLIRPEATSDDMPLFSHSGSGKKLQLWLTADEHLRAVVNDQQFVSNSTLAYAEGFRQVALVINSATDSLELFNGGTSLGRFKLDYPYTGIGRLVFGNDGNGHGYSGRMMEARLWYRALSGGLLGTTYAFKRLSGYEMGLVDYYPMNEGSGPVAMDLTQGANATLKGVTWAMPQGMSLHLDKSDRGMELSRNAITRTPEQDYTLMFWFRTDEAGRGALLSNGRARRTDTGAESLYYIGFESDQLIYRQNGFQQNLGRGWDDGKWHHFAITVNRPRNVANIYMDYTLRHTFKADSLGGISGGHPMIGAARYDYTDSDGKPAWQNMTNWLTGNIDEICLFAQALPQNLVKFTATHGPTGQETGLITYLAFDQQQRQKDNSIEFVPYVYNRRLYKDDKGNIVYEKDPETGMNTQTPQRDYWFTDDAATVAAHIDATTAAPVLPSQNVRNLGFSFVGKDNQLFVNIDEQAPDINKRNIYVTLRDVPDKNGNTMASPVTEVFYVDRNPVRWLQNHTHATVEQGTAQELELTVVNNSGVNHSYSIENCPRWLTFDYYENVIASKNSSTLYATISESLNVGSYDEIIYLVDEEGFREPLYLSVTVEGNLPDWAVNQSLTRYSMNVTARITINGDIDTDSHDLVGVFDNDGVCHGTAHISTDTRTGESLLFLNVYSNTTTEEPLNFKLWNYNTGLVMILTPDSPVSFSPSVVRGTPANPVMLRAADRYEYVMHLAQGWNWVSFPVFDNAFNESFEQLISLPWSNGDAIVDNTADVELVFKDNHWMASNNVDNVPVLPQRCYFVLVNGRDFDVPLNGHIIKSPIDRVISVHEKWNYIGYTPLVNLPLETALSDYYDKAEEGDVIKSHDEFAIFTRAAGVGRWQGSLQYMKPGEGYMLLRKETVPATFTYPFYEPGSTFLDMTANPLADVRSTRAADTRHTMTVTATVGGIALQPGDRLLAYTDAELCGTASAVGDMSADGPEPLYLNIAGDSQKPLWFAIERDGNIIGTTAEVMTYRPNDVIGTPAEPTRINFVHTDYAADRWYSVSGMQLSGKPTSNGVYIHNGKKVVIK